jgi:hypothetical protein
LGGRRDRDAVAGDQAEGAAFGGREVQHFGDPGTGTDDGQGGGAGARDHAAGKADQVVYPFADEEIERVGKRDQAVDRHQPFGARYPHAIAGRQSRVGSQLAVGGEARQIERLHHAVAGQLDASQTAAGLRPLGGSDQVGDPR